MNIIGRVISGVGRRAPWLGIALLTLTPSSAVGQAERYGLERPERGRDLLEAIALRQHNRARRAVGVPPLAWSDALAIDADRFAAEMARTGLYRHSAKVSRSGAQGENIWRGERDLYDYGTMIGAFLDEARYYRAGSRIPAISTTGNWRDAGHYTQIIWRGTTAVGCALRTGRGQDYLVCRYSPPGNIYGQGPED